MSFFVSATSPRPARTLASKKVAIIVAGFLALVAVAQLFNFEKFAPFLVSLGVWDSQSTAQLFISVLAFAEVFSLPFLLSMRLSPAMRVVSMVCGWVGFGMLLYLQLWQQITQATGQNVLIGTTLHLPAGWWSLFLVAAFGVLHIWASWGLWPGKQKK